MMRTRSATLDAVRGCNAEPRVAALAESSATTSVMFVGASSSNAGSIRSTVSMAAMHSSLICDKMAEVVSSDSIHSKISRGIIRRFWPIVWPILTSGSARHI